MEVSTRERQTWTILSLIEWGAQYLTDKGFESARLNCELLLCHVLQCRRIDLYLRFDMMLLPEQLMQFKAVLKRRLAHEPLQFITGQAEFMGLALRVDRRALIPRPETELLVEEVISLSRQSPHSVQRILDIGTGSGNIAISLAKFVSGCMVDTIDVSRDALDLALVNIRHHQVEHQVNLMQQDILADGRKNLQSNYHVIVSNPPYISTSEFGLLETEVKDFEPSVATTDNADGLTFYRVITQIGISCLQTGGWAIVEHAYNQSQDVYDMFCKAGYINIQKIKDYSGVYRFIKAQFR